jgi:hypothetical protein
VLHSPRVAEKGVNTSLSSDPHGQSRGGMSSSRQIRDSDEWDVEETPPTISADDPARHAVACARTLLLPTHPLFPHALPISKALALAGCERTACGTGHRVSSARLDRPCGRCRRAGHAVPRSFLPGEGCIVNHSACAASWSCKRKSARGPSDRCIAQPMCGQDRMSPSRFCRPTGSKALQHATQHAPV